MSGEEEQSGAELETEALMTPPKHYKNEVSSLEEVGGQNAEHDRCAARAKEIEARE